MDYNKLLRQTVNNFGGGEDVIKNMQTRINKQSYTPIKEDGIWGEETQRAVNMLDDVTLQSINNRMIEDRVLKMGDEGNTDRATYQKYLSTHTTKAPKMDLNDKLNQGVRENNIINNDIVTKHGIIPRKTIDKISFYESGNNYEAWNFNGDDNLKNLVRYNEKHANDSEFGAIGKYQFRIPALQDLNYLNGIKDNYGKIKYYQWTGKNNMQNINDFLNNKNEQEQAIRDFFHLNDKYLDKRNSFEHVGKKVRLKNNGIVIDITPADLLIAAHRRGAKNVYNYFSSLAKGVDGVYYLPEEVNNDAFREIENRWKLLKN